MNNLTQNQQDAKRAYLDKQQDTMLVQYKKADTGERNAIIKHIDLFLPITKSKDERIFWLRFREKLERLNEQAGKIQ